MHTRYLVFAFASASLSSIALAQSAIQSFEIITPRPFGYVIGDVIHHTIRLELARPYRLDEASLPKGGRLNRWLELRAPRLKLSEGLNATRYEITLTYQIFNAPKDLVTVFTPEHVLSYSDSNHTLSLIIPAWGFRVAPLVKTSETSSAPFIDLRPDRKPVNIPLKPYVLGLLLSALGLLASLLYLAYIHLTVPLIARNNGPFARACRELKKLRGKPGTESLYRDTLRHIHRAFDQTAGRALFSESLDDFFAEHPRFARLREPIERFFSESREVFFTPENGTKGDSCSMEPLIKLCYQCKDIERGCLPAGDCPPAGGYPPARGGLT